MIPFGQIFFLQSNAWGEEPKEKRSILSLPELMIWRSRKARDRAVQSDIAAAKSDLDQVKAAYYPQLESAAVTAVQDAKEPVIQNGKIAGSLPSLGRFSIAFSAGSTHGDSTPLYVRKTLQQKRSSRPGSEAKEFQLDERKARLSLG